MESAPERVESDNFWVVDFSDSVWCLIRMLTYMTEYGGLIRGWTAPAILSAPPETFSETLSMVDFCESGVIFWLICSEIPLRLQIVSCQLCSGEGEGFAEPRPLILSRVEVRTQCQT